MRDVDDGSYFMVDSNQLHSFEGQEELGEDVRTALQNNLGLAVGEDVLPIAHWQHEATGPLSVSLNGAGELVVLVSAEKFADQPSLLSTLSALEQWLTPMGLRELSEMSGSPSRFVDGVRKLAPDSPLSLASMLRILLINPSIPIDRSACEAALPFCRLETLRIETFRTSEGAVAIRKVLQEATTATPAPTSDVPAPVERVERDTVDSRIDLTIDAPADGAPLLLRGSSYPTAELPLRFDRTESALRPLSHEMFTAGSHLALVVDLEKSPSSSFETSSTFRWDGNEHQVQLFTRHQLDDRGHRRTVHLFVEKTTNAGQVSYVGKVRHTQPDPGASNQPIRLEIS